jgi:hypothetical protein
MSNKSQTILGNTPSKSNSYKVININGHSSLAKTKALKECEDCSRKISACQTA